MGLRVGLGAVRLGGGGGGGDDKGPSAFGIVVFFCRYIQKRHIHLSVHTHQELRWLKAHKQTILNSRPLTFTDLSNLSLLRLNRPKGPFGNKWFTSQQINIKIMPWLLKKTPTRKTHVQ